MQADEVTDLTRRGLQGGRIVACGKVLPVFRKAEKVALAIDEGSLHTLATIS